MEYTFGFIGVGSMGGALARAACRWKPDRVVITNRTLERAAALAEELDCGLAMSNEAVAENARYVFLGVKPHQMAGLLRRLAPVLEKRIEPVVLVSMAAGISTEDIVHMLGFELPVIRIMPNTPVAVGQGLIPY
ncbi:pyrroline-5-carboxylate reductase, partial [gut metagenome]